MSFNNDKYPKFDSAEKRTDPSTNDRNTPLNSRMIDMVIGYKGIVSKCDMQSELFGKPNRLDKKIGGGCVSQC